MLFNSLEYFFFLPAVLLLYYLLPHRFRWVLLLAASYFFYGSWKLEYLGLIVFSTVVDFGISNYLGKSAHTTGRKVALGISLLSNLGLLFFFKYYNFFLGEYHQLVGTAEGEWNALNLLLPVGISFYTFQTLGYTIDVYFGRTKPEKHLGKFAVFVSYFPQLVAGPIERFSRLHPQILAPHTFTYANFANGFRLILYGLFVKMTIADNLSLYSNRVFAEPELLPAWNIWTGMLFFGFQIYADFFGYSLIAIGSAQLMGVNLMNNFRAPYLAASIGDFWQRWHISLSTWFRDYLYIPLGGNRHGQLRWATSILIVFTVSGLWHGANWTFLIWGALHGLIYLQERFLRLPFKLPSSANTVFGILKTYLVVNLAWVFFRADSVSSALDVLQAAFNTGTAEEHFSVDPKTSALLGLFLVLEAGMNGKRFDEWIGTRTWYLRWGLYAVLLYTILAMSGTVNHPFIYFQF